MSFREETLVVKIYTVIVITAGLLFLFFNRPEYLDYNLIFYIVAHIVLDHMEVMLPRESGSVSVSFAIDLALIIIYGPAVAAWAGFSSLIHKRTFKSFNQLFYKMLFNASQLALSAGLAGYVYRYLDTSPGQLILLDDILPIALSSCFYFLFNSFIVMLAITLSQKLSFWGVWLTTFRWSVPNYFATLPLGVLIAAINNSMGIAGVTLLIIPLIVARHTFLMYMDMRNQYISTIKALTKTIDAKDHYTHGHSERVAKYTVWIGQEMHLQEDLLEDLEYLALMHDIGKIGIPEQILNKPSRLSDEEFQLVRDHAAVGAEILSNIRYIGEHADIVRHHHERVDGRGYPDGLTGDEIPLGAKIIGVADAYDAMTSERIYRRPMSKEEAVQELLRCSNTQFDAMVVEAFIRALRRKGEIR
ncbi:MAG TPA: HD-GYP domain-containing protein [Firmicutes bacterium]|nr:HD-GYP domain-containing protein [Bacillota bacterium]